MEKKKLEFPSVENQHFDFHWGQVNIQPYISYKQQEALINNYLDRYFEPEFRTLKNVPFDYLSAEESLKLDIIGLCTDVQIFDDNNEGKPSFTIDNLISSPELWDGVRSRIKNYNEFYSRLQHIVAERKEERIIQNSVGSVIDSTVKKVLQFLETASSLKLSEEDENKIRSLLKEIDNSEILKQLMGKVK